MSLGPKMVGTARALRWAGVWVMKATVVVAIVAAAAYGLGLSPNLSSGTTRADGAATTPAPAASPDLAAAESKAVARVNELRSERSLPSLTRSSSLDEMAQYHSEDMATNEYYAHDSPDGETVADRFSRFAPHCGPGAENIHRGDFTGRLRIYGTETTVDPRTSTGMARYLVQSWMHSDGHRANLLDRRWSSVGIGIAKSGQQFYATAVFCEG